MSGHYEYIVAERNRVLSSVRMSQSARARALGHKLVMWQHAPAVAAEAKAAEAKAEPPVKKRLGLGPRSGLTGRIKQVITAFAVAFEVDIEGVLSESHARNMARPRQCAMHFLRFEMQMSTGMVGRALQRDHTTVISGCQAVKIRIREDDDFSARYRRAVRALRAMWAE